MSDSNRKLYKAFSGKKLGYLKEDFRLFHIKDQRAMEFEYHHHDFHKIVVFISGKVTYHIEGKAYALKPWDILLVGNTEIHKPQISPDKMYERIVLWVYPEFLERNNSQNTNLLSCFQTAKEKEYHLIRVGKDSLSSLKETLVAIEEEKSSGDFGSDILVRSLFFQFMVSLNRLFSSKENLRVEKGLNYDEGLSAIINYINQNLQGDLSIDKIASRFFMSRYNLMHKFKKETGTSIYSYIIQKRLILSKALIREGLPITEVSQECGFGDYSSFIRAFKKSYGKTPREYYNGVIEGEEPKDI